MPVLHKYRDKKGTAPFSTPFSCSINPTSDVEMTIRKLRLRGMSNAYETYGS
jgi:hypothetical protein